MDVIWHAAFDNLAAHELRVVFESHMQVLLGRDLRFSGHLWEA
jgi:hypothetical protein